MKQKQLLFDLDELKMVIFWIIYGTIVGVIVGTFVYPTGKLIKTIMLGMTRGTITGLTIGAVNAGGVFVFILAGGVICSFFTLAKGDLPIGILNDVIRMTVYGAIFGAIGGIIIGGIVGAINKKVTRIVIGGVFGGVYGGISWEFIRMWYCKACTLW